MKHQRVSADDTNVTEGEASGARGPRALSS